MPETTPIAKETELRDALKRCPPQTLEAALEYHRSGDLSQLPLIVMGIIERYVEPEAKEIIRAGKDETRLFEDLGIDSLLMVEIVILVEETLDLQIENDELRNLRTLGDIKLYLRYKVQGLPMPESDKDIPFEEIAAVMPHQHPFLFVQSARLNAEEAKGIYDIRGDESFLEGHFKGNPVFPASLMLESLGQLAVLFLLKTEREELSEIDPTSIYFYSVDSVRCTRICRPQDKLELKVKLKKLHEPLALFEGSIHCNGEKVAVANDLALTFGVKGAEPINGAASARLTPVDSVTNAVDSASVSSHGSNGTHPTPQKDADR